MRVRYSYISSRYCVQTHTEEIFRTPPPSLSCTEELTVVSAAESRLSQTSVPSNPWNKDRCHGWHTVCCPTLSHLNDVISYHQGHCRLGNFRVDYIMLRYNVNERLI